MTGGETQRGGDAPDGSFEAADAPAFRVGLTLAALVTALLLVCAAVAGLLLLFARGAPPEAGPPAPALAAPEPRLQAYEPGQRLALERRAAAALRPTPGRLGIDAAMARVAAEGWPAEPPR